MSNHEGKGIDMNAMLGDLIGKRYPGGCEDCDAYQEVESGGSPGVFVMRIYHDDTCPFLKRHEP